MRCQPTAPQSPCSGPASVLAVHGLQESPEDRRGGLRGIKGVSGYPKSLPWSLHRHVSDHLPCSKQSRFFRRVLSILPPSPLSATAHLQPLAQPTALRHPGSRCDIDSHPDCRPFLILIVAPQKLMRGLSGLPFSGRSVTHSYSWCVPRCGRWCSSGPAACRGAGRCRCPRFGWWKEDEIRALL